MRPHAEGPEAVHEANRRVDVGLVRRPAPPAEVHPVEVEVVLEEELVDERGDLGAVGDGLHDGELGGRRVDVYLDDDEVLRRRPGHALEDLEERPGGVRALWALRLRANRP